MIRLKPHTRLLLVLMCVLMLGARVSGAHLHLCLDGNEPPVVLHMQSDVDHHQAEPAHTDVDVSVAGHPLAKKGGVDHDHLSAMVASVYLLFFSPQQAVAAHRSEITVPLVRSAHYLRPPLRGPPVNLPA
jgi:hypothetical protein